MNLFMYLDKGSYIHKLPVGIKLLTLFCLSSLIFTIDNLVFTLFCFLFTIFLFFVGKIEIKHIIYQLRFLYLSVVLIFLFQYYFNSLTDALNVSFRLITIVYLGILFTFTSKTSEIITTIERILKPFSVLGINHQKVSLSISLAIRFIPLVSITITQVREAQKVRGLGNNVFAMIIPVIIKTLKSGDEIAEAIDARMFYNEPK